MSEQDHEQRADELDREADRLAQENARLKEEISDVRDDWRRKQQDDGVPGAVAPEDESERASGDPPDPDSST
jgi:hypothetical protein